MIIFIRTFSHFFTAVKVFETNVPLATAWMPKLIAVPTLYSQIHT